MSDYVLDASALLALLNGEEGAESVRRFLPDAVISAVNLAEVVTRLTAVGMPERDVREVLSILAMETVPFDEEQAYHAGLLYLQTRAFGLSLGDRACLALARTMNVPAITADQMDHAYTGPRFTNGRVAGTLDRHGLDYAELDDNAMCRTAAGLLSAGNVVGWFQGAMEWGPRALGNRSILADPRRDDMREVLNARVKHREKFRPFAPSILLEATGDYFDQDYPDPFMIKVYN